MTWVAGNEKQSSTKAYKQQKQANQKHISSVILKLSLITPLLYFIILSTSHLGRSSWRACISEHSTFQVLCIVFIEKQKAYNLLSQNTF